MTQLHLFGELEAETPTWQYHAGLPARDGLAKYTHLIRWGGDPKETMGRGREGRKDADEQGVSGGRSSTHWKRTHSVEVYKQKITELLTDGRSRTFNCICVQLTGTTADVWFEKAPDIALWSLVEEGKLCWAQELGVIFFLDSSFVEFA